MFGLDRTPVEAFVNDKGRYFTLEEMVLALQEEFDDYRLIGYGALYYVKTFKPK